jgi:hypothetical protein
MAYEDFASPEHRLDNLSNHLFVVSWACIRWHIGHNQDTDITPEFLMGYMIAAERSIAYELGLNHASLVRHIEKIGSSLCAYKSAKDETESTFPNL